MPKPEQQALQVQIEIDDATSQGMYSNLALLAHNETEFVIDFVFIQPQAPKARVRSRILLNPVHMKRLQAALSDNIRRFEEKFGPIKAPEGPEKESAQYQGHYL